MSGAPERVRSFAEHAEARALRELGAEAIARDALRAKIQVRRFAGPASFSDRLGHLRVAHLTDLHIGRVTPMQVHKTAVKLTNAEQPDLIVITGDFVCHSTKYLDELTEIVSGFEAPVVAVLGNHDYWSGADEVRWALRRGGVEVLDNRNTTLSIHGERLQLVGLDDAYTGHARRDEALRGLVPGVATLGLSHIAEEADALWNAGVNLVLSGHTHAGQVTLARLHELAIGKLAGHKYVHGLYGTRQRDRAPNGAVYVGAGIGAAVMPLRLGERGQREVTIFELGAEPGTLEEHHDEQAPLPGRKPSQEKVAKRNAVVHKKRARREAKAAKSQPKHAPQSHAQHSQQSHSPQSHAQHSQQSHAQHSQQSHAQQSQRTGGRRSSPPRQG